MLVHDILAVRVCGCTAVHADVKLYGTATATATATVMVPVARWRPRRPVSVSRSLPVRTERTAATRILVRTLPRLRVDAPALAWRWCWCRWRPVCERRGRLVAHAHCGFHGAVGRSRLRPFSVRFLPYVRRLRHFQCVRALTRVRRVEVDAGDTPSREFLSLLRCGSL